MGKDCIMVKCFIQKEIAVISCFLMLLSVFSVTPVSANSAMTHWSGSDSSGIIVTDEDCPIIVENELLIFDIQTFPQHIYDSEEDQHAYSAKVTAQYTFYNPSDYTVTAHLLFPFGNIPEYGDYFDSESDDFVNVRDIDDTARFDITVNGEPVEKDLRHTLLGYRGTFDLESDLAKLNNGYISDSYFNPDMPVTKYTYLVSGVDEKNNAASVAFDVGKFDGKTRYLFMDKSGLHTQENDTLRISTWAENDEELTLYVFGQTVNNLKWTFYKDGGVRDGDEIKGNIILLTTEDMTFKEFALAKYTEETGIHENDWYNAVVAELNLMDSWGEYGIIENADRTFDLTHSLMRWYEYEITVEPGESIVNTVTAPLYPSINDDWNPSIYEYTYLLSPAQTWSEFGKLKIVVNTPFSMTESNLGEFEKDNNGYRLSLDGLPEGDLKFTLCSEENPEFHVYTHNYEKNPTKFIIIASIIVLACAVVFAVIFINHKKKHKKSLGN